MAASTNDKLTNTASTTTTRPQATQVTSSRSAGVFTLACNSLTGWPTDSKVHFSTYKLTTAGAKIAGSQIDMDGIVSGTSIGSITIRGGSDVGNAIGDIVEMAPTAAWGYDLNKWGTVSHDSQGNLLTAAVQAALGLSTLNGYTPVGFTPNTVTYNGNRSYDMVFNSQDLTSFLSNGMRIRTTRTVTAPTQCTSLNGTNQYYSKTSPGGATFTDTFSTGAWIKPSAYQAGGIISRFNGTNGWYLSVNASGQVLLQCGASTKSVLTYQSVGLNKWLHVVLTITGTTGTAYFDGVAVPFTLTGSGTVTQAGNLEVGSYNATNFFAGKIAQPFVASKVLSQTEVRAIYSQGLALADMTTYSIISAYSFNNSINDINTTNANNLTANGSAVATNTDSPFTQDDTVTPSGTNDFAIITKKVFSTNTTLTVQVPEGCTIPTSGGVSSVVYSSNKVPYGFPNDRARFTISAQYNSDTYISSFTANVWVNPNTQLNLPVGVWRYGWQATRFVNAINSSTNAKASLSTTNSSQGDVKTSAELFAGVGNMQIPAHFDSDIAVSVPTQIYLNILATNTASGTMGFGGSDGTTIIYAELAVL